MGVFKVILQDAFLSAKEVTTGVTLIILGAVMILSIILGISTFIILPLVAAFTLGGYWWCLFLPISIWLAHTARQWFIENLL